jgi:kynurenine formamidase
MRIIDLSVCLEAGIPSDPPFMLPEITYRDHTAGALEFAAIFKGLTASDLPDGQAAAIETLKLTTHNGTHMDAPWHFHSTMNKGERAWTIDEIPLEWCIGAGVKLDFRHLPDGHVATAAEVEAELKRISYTLQPLDIVLVNTRAGEAYGGPGFLDGGCGMGRGATLYLLERGVRVCGTDAWSWDAPFPATAKRYAETRDASIIWEGHKASMEIGYCHLEKLTNLDKLPPFGFRVSCLPVKVKAGSAGWTRAVAFIDEP